MSENSLLTKYRPTRFKDVIGQDEIVQSYKRSLEQDFGHVYLFTGESGCGKTTLARLGVRSLGIKSSNTIEIDAATNNSVEEMRSLVSLFNYKPLNGGMHAVIIDEIHCLTKAAWQPLLKCIEEPPNWLFWFFCTTIPDKVPKTIKTRCLHYKLNLVKTDELIDFLDGIVQNEGLNTSRNILQLCALEAHGSPRQALANLSVCFDVENRQEAARIILNETESAGAAYSLVRALWRGADWVAIQPVLQSLSDQEPEAIRQTVRAYLTTVVLSSTTVHDAIRATGVLDIWMEPFDSINHFSSVVVATIRSINYLSE